MMNAASLQIGQVAQKTGLSVDAIRFYEKSGLLSRPARTHGGYRLYQEREIADLEFIQKAQQLGFSLNEIRELFSIQRHPHEVCEHVRDLIAQKLTVCPREDCPTATTGSGVRPRVAAMPHRSPATAETPRLLPGSGSDYEHGAQRKQSMKVEIFYFSGCPNHLPAVDSVREVLAQEGTPAEMVEVEVNDAATAQQVGFLGSPSIRVDGQDIERAVRGARAFGMMCRTYIDGGRRAGVPPPDWIRAAVREAKEKGA